MIRRQNSPSSSVDRRMLWSALFLWFVHGVAAAPQSNPPISVELTYEFSDYSCEAQIVRAVLSVIARSGGAGLPRVSLTSVLDVSGSMAEGDRMPLMHGTNNYLVKKLVEADVVHKFGSVTFSSSAQELTRLEELNPEVALRAQTAINATGPGGGTNMFEGIRHGMQQQTQDPDTNGFVRVVFLFTDGVPSVGVTQPDRIVAEVKKLVDASNHNVLIYTFGVGSNVAVKLLEDIADVGGGVMYVVSKPAEMPIAFGSAIGGLLTEAALKSTYSATATGDAGIVEVLTGWTIVEQTEKRVEIYIGDIAQEERRDIVIAFSIEATCERRDGLVVEASYVDPVTFEDVDVAISDEKVERAPLTPTEREGKASVEAQATRFKVASELDGAADDLRQGRVGQCIDKLDGVHDYIHEKGQENDPFLGPIARDVKTFSEGLKADPQATVENQVTLSGLVHAVSKQRTGLTDSDKFESVGLTTTTAKRKSGKDAVKEVLHETVAEFALNVSYAVGALKKGEDYDEVDVVITIGAPDLGDVQAPLSLTTVLDKSDSMQGETFDLLIETQKRMIDWLLDMKTDEISLGVLVFSDEVEAIQALKKLAEIDVDSLKQSLDGVATGGKSNLGAALHDGVEEQIGNPNCAGSQAVFLLSDGVPSDGRDKIVDELRDQLKRATAPVTIYAFGLGDFDAALLREVVEVGHGELYILRDERDIAFSFGDAAAGLLSIRAKDIQIQVSTDDDAIEIVDVFPSPEAQSSTTTTVSLHDLFKGEKRDVLVKLRLPKGAEVETLLTVKVSYADVLTCDRVESEPISISRKKSHTSPKRRALEQEVAALLDEASVHCFNEIEIVLAISVIDKASETVADSSYSDDKYRADLEADLIRVRRVLISIKIGITKPDEGCLIVVELKDLLETQRAKEGTTGTKFQVGAVYDTHSRETGRESLAKDVTGRPIRPKEDIFSVTYSDPPIEITTVKQNVTVELVLDVIDQPESVRPSHVAFVVDVSLAVDDEALDMMKALVLRIWKAYLAVDALKATSRISIIIYGSPVQILVSGAFIEGITEEHIDSIFAELKRGDDEGFMKAIETGMTAMDTFEELDLIMIPFVGHALGDTGPSPSASYFEDLVTKLGFPITFAPVVVRSDISVEYFDAFPLWVRSQITFVECASCVEGTFKLLKPLLFAAAAKRVAVEIEPTSNVTVVDIGGTLGEEKGEYLISDLFYGKKTRLTLTLAVAEYSHDQILFTCSYRYFDVRSLYEWTKDGEPLFFERVDADVLQERVAARSSTSRLLEEVKALLESGDYEGAMSRTALALAFIEDKDTEDEVLSVILRILKALIVKIRSLIDGQVEVKAVVAYVRRCLKRLDVKAVLVFPEASSEEETGDEESVPEEVTSTPVYQPPVPVEELEVDFDKVMVISKLNVTVEVPLVIKSPPSDGTPVDAHVTFMIDSSIESDKNTVAKMTEALLHSLAGRQAKRSVRILSWNDAVSLIFETEDIQKDDISDALGEMKDVHLSGDLHFTLALEEAKKISETTSAAIPVLYCIIANGDYMKESASTLIDSAKAASTDPSSIATIFVFASGVESFTLDVMKDFSEATGGQAFQLDLKKDQAADEEIKHRIANVARHAVLWIDTVYSKRATMDIKTSQHVKLEKVNADLDRVVVDMAEEQIILPPLPFGVRIVISVVLKLGAATNNPASNILQRQLLNSESILNLMDVKSGHYNIRQERQESSDATDFGVDAVEQRVVDAIERLSRAQDNLTTCIMLDLGKNAIKGAQLSVEQLKVLAVHSGIKDRPEAKAIIRACLSMRSKLERYSKSRQKEELIQAVTNEIGEMKPDKEYLSDQGSLLTLSHNPVSARNNDSEVQPVITVQTPDRPEDAVKHQSLAVAAVFDAVEYSTLLSQEVSLFDTQKWLVRDLIRELVETEDYDITFTVLGNHAAGMSSSATIHLNQSQNANIENELDNLFESISTGDYPAGLDSGLQIGLKSLEESSETSRRVLLLFVASFATCLVEDNSYEGLLRPYLTHPINPVKVITYVIGPSEPPRSDSISILTGGTRYRVQKTLHVNAAVKDTVKELRDPFLRGMRLHVMQPEWMKAPIIVVSDHVTLQSKHHLTVALPDMKPGKLHSVQLSVPLDEWEVPDADLLEYSVSYFHSGEERWYTTPSYVFRLHRTTPEAFDEIQRLNATVTQAFANSIASLKAEKVKEAAEALRAALEELDASQYQDDSFISAVLTLLADAYEDCLQLLHSESGDVEPLLDRMTSSGTGLGLDTNSELRKGGGGGLSSVVKGALVLCSLCAAFGLVYLVSKCDQIKAFLSSWKAG